MEVNINLESARTHVTTESDEEIARQLAAQYEREDEVLARAWQDEERKEVLQTHPKYLTFVESTYADLRQREDEDIFDDDEYIGRHVDNRRASKRMNMSDAKAVEFKSYSTRNTGAKEYKQKSRFLSKISREAVQVFKIKQDGGDYARVVGENTNQVRCLEDGLIYKAHFLQKVRLTSRIYQGSLVLVKFRNYQANVVDVIHVYTPQEEATLIEMNEIRAHDPMMYLPAEVILMIVGALESVYACNALRQLNHSWNSFLTEHCPVPYLPLKMQFERRIADLEWEGLSQFHSEFFNGRLLLYLQSSNQCRFFWSSFYHLRTSCDLKPKIFKIAEEVWNEFLPKPKEASTIDTDSFMNEKEIPMRNEKYWKKVKAEPIESTLFTYSRCLYLLFRQRQLNNFASCVLWVWVKVHQRFDLDSIDLDALIRCYMIQKVRSGVTGYINSLREKLAASVQKTRIESKIEELEYRWKSLLDQPVVDLDLADFTAPTEDLSESDSDDWHSEEFADYD